MRKLTFYIIILGLFLAIRSPKQSPDFSIHFESAESAIGTEEDPSARLHYEELLLADPKTGKIPKISRQQELLFARTLPVKTESSSNRVAEEEFRKAGPYNIGGRTRAAAFDVRNEQTIIAGGVSGSIWKTTNGGTSWQKSTTANIRNGITTLVQDTRPGYQNTWYFGSGELLGNSARSLSAPFRGSGIYQSNDNGNSWAIIPSTVDNATPDAFTSMFQYIWRLETNPSNMEETEIFAAAFGGILKSSNGGNTWEVVLGEKLFETSEEDLNCANAPFYTEIHRTSSNIYFATLSSITAAGRSSVCNTGALYPDAGYYYSLDGNTWHNITPNALPIRHQRTAIASNSSGTEIYFLTDSERPSLLKYTISNITESNITGRWTNLPDGVPQLGGSYGDFDSQDGYNLMVSVHPTNDNVVFVGGTNLYRSTNGFTSDTQTDWIGGYSPENDASQYDNHHADQHLLLFPPSNPNQMISGSDGGLIKTNGCLNDSVTWYSLNNGYVTSQFYSIAQEHGSTSVEMIGGLQDNGSWFRNNIGENPVWHRVLGGDGGYAAAPTDTDYRYVSFQNSQIYRVTLTDNYKLKSFARVDPSRDNDATDYLFINPYQLDPKNENRMFLTGGNAIWRNHNLAQIPSGSQQPTSVGWKNLEDSQINDGVYTCVAISPTADRVYAGITGELPGIVRIDNASSDLTATTLFLRDSTILPASGHISCIAINPENADHLLVTVSNYNVPSIFETFDAGNTWNDISGNLEQFPDGRGNGPSIRWAEIIPTNDGIAYFVGTSIGLYATDSPEGSSTQWMQNGAEEIGHAVITMMNYRTKDGRLIIASHGNGTFEAYLSNAKKFSSEINQPLKIITNVYPNPFIQSVTFQYELPENEKVAINLYDNTGKLVRNLLYAQQYSGDNRIVWDGMNNGGAPVKPGIYYITIFYQGKKYTERVIRGPY